MWDLEARKRLVLIGAGSVVFTRGLLADLVSAPDLGPWEIGLVDIDPDALGIATRLAERMVAARGEGDRIRILASPDRTELLPGADVVVVSIAVGGRSAWLRDWEIARDFGVHQPVGDSVLPGGISRTLRIVPVMVEIARDVVRLCADAFFFNYGNPMTANVAAMHQYADAEAVGLCHGVVHVHRELAAYAGKPFGETSILYCGLNHLTFIYDFRWRGRDAWPIVRERLARERAEPLDPDDVGAMWPKDVRASHNPFSWTLFERYGAYPAANDRHVTEFFPERFRDGEGAYYGKTLGVDAFPIQSVLDWSARSFETMRREADGESPIDERMFDRSSDDQEELIEILRSLLLDRRTMYSVNVPNEGVVPNMPLGAVLELPAVATARGLRPIAVPDLPPALAAVLQRRLAPIMVTVEAAMTGDLNLVTEALLLDGAVSEPDVARALAARYVEEHRRYLPQFA